MKKTILAAAVIMMLTGCGSTQTQTEETTQAPAAAEDKYSFAEDAVNKMAAEDSLNLSGDYGAGMTDEQREKVANQIEAAKMMDPEYAAQKGN